MARTLPSESAGTARAVPGASRAARGRGRPNEDAVEVYRDRARLARSRRAERDVSDCGLRAHRSAAAARVGTARRVSAARASGKTLGVDCRPRNDAFPSVAHHRMVVCAQQRVRAGVDEHCARGDAAGRPGFPAVRAFGPGDGEHLCARAHRRAGRFCDGPSVGKGRGLEVAADGRACRDSAGGRDGSRASADARGAGVTRARGGDARTDGARTTRWRTARACAASSPSRKR